MLKTAKKMQETEEKNVVILDLQDEDKTDENERARDRVQVEVTANFLRKLLKKIKDKLKEWNDILEADYY
jgi:hypothetical protein